MGILGSFVSWGTQDSFIHGGGRFFFELLYIIFYFFIFFHWEKTVSIIHGIFIIFCGKSVSIIYGLFTNRRSTLAV